MADKAIPVSNGKHRLSSPERRAAIVEAAVQLFAEKGFRGTTTRELAARVGVSEPVLYEHFKTKSDLYTAIIDARSKEYEACLQQIANLAETQDDYAFFLNLAHSITQGHDQDESFIRLLMFSGLEGHELKEILYERFTSKMFGMVADYIEQRIASGAMRPVHPMVASRVFFGMVAHYSFSSQIFQCSRMDLPRDQVLSNMIDVFLGGLCVSTPAVHNEEGLNK